MPLKLAMVRLQTLALSCRLALSADWYKPQEVTDAILEALKRNFVFQGIPQNHLAEVRHVRGGARASKKPSKVA